MVTTPWWTNEEYQIGLLSQNVRPIKLLNTLTHQEHFLEVSGRPRDTRRDTRMFLALGHTTGYSVSAYS